jgi:hypothetical protein
MIIATNITRIVIPVMPQLFTEGCFILYTNIAQILSVQLYNDCVRTLYVMKLSSIAMTMVIK